MPEILEIDRSPEKDGQELKDMLEEYKAGQDVRNLPDTSPEFRERMDKLEETLRENGMLEKDDRRDIDRKDNYKDQIADLYEKHGHDPNEMREMIKDLNPRISEDRDKTWDNIGKVSEFIQSLDLWERKSLIPLTAEESREYSESMGSPAARDYIQREISGHFNMNMELMDKMAECLQGSKCLEVAGGSGLLSHLLQERGVDIICTEKTDPYKTDTGAYYTAGEGDRTYTSVEYMDAKDAVEKYGKDVDYLVISWCPYGSNLATECSELLYQLNPDAHILWIGEDKYGCTGNNAFFNNNEMLWDTPLSQTDEFHVRTPEIHDIVIEMQYDGPLAKGK